MRKREKEREAWEPDIMTRPLLLPLKSQLSIFIHLFNSSKKALKCKKQAQAHDEAAKLRAVMSFGPGPKLTFNLFRGNVPKLSVLTCSLKLWSISHRQADTNGKDGFECPSE